MDAMVVMMLLAGLVLLFVGGEILIRGASRLAVAAGISPLVVGLTVVAFSTSAPELAVTVQSAWAGQADIAMGNVVGSNIANVLLILGLSALVSPLVVKQKLVRLDVPLMIGISALVWVLALNGGIERWEGGLLVLGLVGYTWFSIWESRRETQAVQQEYSQEFGGKQPPAPWMNVALVVVGIALLVVGANWLVESAVAGARWAGLDELVIGLTIIAVGTSLPELATSLIATYHGERDIAVGNVVGSNIFNLLSVLGLTALVAPDTVPVAQAALNFDIPVMLAVAVACLPVFFVGNRIERWEGGLFVAYYVAYLAYLVLASLQHSVLPAYSLVMLSFVIPLTVITFLVVMANKLRRRRQAQ